MKASRHYLHNRNRRTFTHKLSKLLDPYREELSKGDEAIRRECSRNSESNGFKLLRLQKVAIDYLNLYSQIFY